MPKSSSDLFLSCLPINTLHVFLISPMLSTYYTHLILFHMITPIIVSKVKLKFSPCLTKHNAMKTYGGSGDIFPRVLVLGTRWTLVNSTSYKIFIVQFSPSSSYFISLRLLFPTSILILSSYLCLCLSRGLFPRGVLTISLCTFLSCPLPYPVVSSPLI
jgi:hypothetical protein